MAFMARTAENIRDGKLGGTEFIEIDGLRFGPRMSLYHGEPQGDSRMVDSSGKAFGAPTKAMLENNRLVIRTLAGDRPWPGSTEDRIAKGAGANGMQNALMGAVSPFGRWPDRLEMVAQSNTRLKREDPVGYTQRVLTQRPYKAEEKAVAMSKAHALAAGMDAGRFADEGLDIGAIPDASGQSLEAREEPEMAPALETEPETPPSEPETAPETPSEPLGGASPSTRGRRR